MIDIVPQVLLVRVVKTRRGEKLQVLCDDNVWYLFPELSKKINVSVEALRVRFTRMHWSNPKFLAFNRIKAFRPTPKKKAVVKKKKSGFAGLSDKSRDSRLGKLSRLGSLEQSL